MSVPSVSRWLRPRQSMVHGLIYVRVKMISPVIWPGTEIFANLWNHNWTSRFVLGVGLGPVGEIFAYLRNHGCASCFALGTGRGFRPWHSKAHDSIYLHAKIHSSKWSRLWRTDRVDGRIHILTMRIIYQGSHTLVRTKFPNFSQTFSRLNIFITYFWIVNSFKLWYFWDWNEQYLTYDPRIAIKC